MQTTQVTIFGPDREVVDGVISEIRSLCERKGIEYNGPHPHPKIDLSEKEADLDQEGVELFGEQPTEHEIEQLDDETVFPRSFHFHRYGSDNVVNEIVKREYPDRVFIRVKVEETEFIGADHGNAPFTYDPNVDYTSDY